MLKIERVNSLIMDDLYIKRLSVTGHMEGH